MPFRRPRGDGERPGCCMGEESRVAERQPRHDSCLAAHFPDSRVILEILEVGKEKGQRRRAVVRHLFFPYHHQHLHELLNCVCGLYLLTFGWVDYSSEARDRPGSCLREMWRLSRVSHLPRLCSLIQVAWDRLQICEYLGKYYLNLLFFDYGSRISYLVGEGPK